MNQLEPFNDIKNFIFDVDGVLTNSRVIVFESGALVRQMNVRDGYAMKKAIEKDYRIGIITGGRSAGVISRLKGLGIVDIYTGISDKLDAYQSYMELYDLNPEQTLYMGDDLPDLPVMHRVGLAAAPADADHEILQFAAYVSPKEGGDGCVRDIIEKVMRIQHNWVLE